MAYVFADNMQKENDEKLKFCVENSKDFSKATGDPATNFIECYRNLIKDMDKSQDSIKNEFNNYV